MITELVGSYSLTLVATSYLVAVAASFAALSLAGRVAISHGLGKVVWLTAGSMAMGSGIWSMHFVGMLAFSLPIPVQYDLRVVILSMIPAVAASALALTVASRERLTAHALMIGGVLMGTAIAAMHYTGMAAVVTAANLRYDPTLFLASIVIAMGASFAALWIAFRLREAETARGHWLRGAAALVMGVAIAGMHYTAMAAARFTLRADAVIPQGEPIATPIWLAFGLAGAALVITGAAIFGSILDVLRRQRSAAMEDLRRAMEEVKRGARLATLGQITATVSHELRNPLGTIRTSMFSIRERTKAKGLKVEPALDRAERSLVRCVSIIGDLQEFTRGVEIDREPTNLDSWMAGVLADQQVPTGIDVIKNLDAGVEVPLDREKMIGVISNLVENAVQAIQSGQETDDHAAAVGRIEVSSRKDDSRVVISVADSGPGFPRDDLAKIFEPLFTTKTRGLGLGLSIVQKIVVLHGGAVSAENGRDGSAVVTVELPLELSAP